MSMNSIIIASREQTESEILKKVVEKEFNVSIITSPSIDQKKLEETSLILLDSNFTENSGIDFLMNVLRQFYLPVLMLTSVDDHQCAVEAMRSGASNYLVKTENYHEILNTAIKDAIEKFSQYEEMKETIVALKARIVELEKQLGISAQEEVAEEIPEPPKEINLIEELVSRFKQGDINLPSLSQTYIQFKALMKSGAGIKEIADLLKQDVAISSKLINISNTAYYRGMSENKNLYEAINRLGLRVTKQYVGVISNRSLYTTSNKKYNSILEELWEHSLSCAYAAEIVANIIGFDFQNDIFTLALLHDIGKLLLIQVIGELETKGKFGRDIRLEELFQTMGSFHGRFGAVLLKRWNFPEIYLEISQRHHDDPVENSSKELLIIQFANLLSKSIGYTVSKEQQIDIENSKSGYFLRLRENEIEETQQKTKALMEEVKHTV